MFMPKGEGSGEMKNIDTQEAQAAMPELEPLKHPTDDEIDQMMDMLGYDALDDSMPENRHERKRAVGKEGLYRGFHAAGKHGELFVLRGEGDRIIGLLGLRADAPNQTGHVTLLRSATRDRAQFDITEKLLIAAEHYLRQSPRNCTRGVIDAENPSEHLQMSARHGLRSRFWTFGSDENTSDNEAESNPLESGQ